jgi:hypothetical protein
LDDLVVMAGYHGCSCGLRSVTGWLCGGSALIVGAASRDIREVFREIWRAPHDWLDGQPDVVVVGVKDRAAVAAVEEPLELSMTVWPEAASLPISWSTAAVKPTVKPCAR